MILTDHDLLQWIFKLPDVTGHLPRWRLRLSKLDFDVVHGANIKNQARNALLFATATGEHHVPIEENLLVVILETALENDASTQLILGMNSIIDDSNIRAVA